MEPILSLKNVCSYYDKVQVLYDINVDVYPGEIVSVIGANGAGKSTMMKTIMGLVHMGRGEVTFDGKSSTACMRTRSARRALPMFQRAARSSRT